MKAIICVVIFQVAIISARSGLRDECRNLQSVFCSGVRQSMPIEDCETGYDYFYCAKAAVKDASTGDWSVKNAVFSSHMAIDEATCIVLSDQEIRLVLPKNVDREMKVSDLRRICEQKKKNSSFTILNESDSSEEASTTTESYRSSGYSVDRAEIEKEIYLTEKHAFTNYEQLREKIKNLSTRLTDRAEIEKEFFLNEKHTTRNEEEINRHIDDLYSLTAQNRLITLVLFIIFLIVVVAHRRSQKAVVTPLSFYNDHHRLISDCDDKVYKPTVI